jgi:diacylglycerol O-acyltransferase
MTHYKYERLTALDSSFLVFEEANHNTPMHVASVAIFEGAPLAHPGGGIDIERISAHIASRLHRIPRYRERIAYIPIEAHPVWVDDARFNLNYHVRHTCLPKPGDERQLKRLAARVMSQHLDRGKPLWETWIVDGLQGDRVAMISKVHHCMVDGISGVDLLTVVLGTEAETTVADAPRWIPRPVPTRAELVRDELIERLAAPLNLVSRALRQPLATLAEARNGLAAISDLASSGMHLASDTPFNQPIGPHRRFDWSSMDIAAIKAIRERLGGTLNDVVLATVAGAVRRFLERRSLAVNDLEFRVFVPVSTRSAQERGTLGNRVAGWIVDLPIGEPHPVKRIAKIQQATAALKKSNQARGAEILMEMADWTPSTVLGLAMRLGTRAQPANMVVTNVPGPPTPLYLLGARMLEAYPMVPLAMNMALGIALFSNAGRLFWGFHADWDVIPDLHDFVQAIEASFAELGAAAPEPAAGRPSRSRRAGARVGSDGASHATA